MKSRISLAKVTLCLLIACSTFFGYILADPVLTLRTVFTGVGIFILATGAATCNSVQEYQLDSQLERTRNRPLPKGLLSLSQAGAQGLILLLAGLLILFAATDSFLPVIIAAFAILLYNGVYTPLKKKTVLAIIPGTLCGALPPYIGWLSGGGSAFCYAAALLITLLVLWQVPHFWLVLLIFKEDYAKSSLPNLLQQFHENTLKLLLVTWIGSLASVMLMFITLPLPLTWLFRIAIFVNACLLLLTFAYGLAMQKPCDYRRLFIVLNCTLFLHMLLLVAGRVST